MPIFRTNKNIFVAPWEDELFDPNWMDSDEIKLPPKVDWDYSRELKIEDVDIWEEIYRASGNTGLFAAWSPYAEFYLITLPYWYEGDKIETFYGKNAGKRAYARAVELGMPVHLNKIWVEPEDMWLYE